MASDENCTEHDSMQTVALTEPPPPVLLTASQPEMTPVLLAESHLEMTPSAPLNPQYSNQSQFPPPSRMPPHPGYYYPPPSPGMGYAQPPYMTPSGGQPYYPQPIAIYIGQPGPGYQGPHPQHHEWQHPLPQPQQHGWQSPQLHGWQTPQLLQPQGWQTPNPQEHGWQTPQLHPQGWQTPHPQQHGLQTPHPQQHGLQTPHPQQHGLQTPQSHHQSWQIPHPQNDGLSASQQPLQQLPQTLLQPQEEQQQASVKLNEPTATVVTSGPVVLDVGKKPVSMTSAVVLSCLVFWFCGILFGGIAFIMAMMGESAAVAGDIRGAVRMKKTSCGVSIAGIVIGLIIIAVVGGILGAASSDPRGRCYNSGSGYFYYC